MIKKFTELEFDRASYKDEFELECKQCHSIFRKTKKKIIDAAIIISSDLKKNSHRDNYLLFCSRKCHSIGMELAFETNCKVCNTYIFRPTSQSKNKSVENINNETYFCSQSCSATFNNKNKSHGTRRSKLEVWIEKRLTELYPDLEIDFNKKDAINSELDIYIPSIKLAFELNGIFHYEPIYGDTKLNQIRNNDQNKFESCISKGISLCIIDCSKLTYFKESNAKKYLEIIQNIIESRQCTLLDSNQ